MQQFSETADNEKEHAKRFWVIRGGEVEIQASYPAGATEIQSEFEAAADGELMEWGTLYKDAAETARKEGFEKKNQEFI